MKKTSLLLCGILTAFCTIIGHGGTSSGTENPDNHFMIPPEVAADYIHTVIQANRTVYSTHVVEWLQENGVVFAEEQWEAEKALPLPAQMLLYSGLLAAEEGGEVSFRLASLWPILPGNGPATEFERRGLEAVAKDPSQPYTGLIKSGEQRLFQAVYADRAVSKVCVSCHNGHEKSPRKDYKLNDVMGGLVITLPVDEVKGKYLVEPSKAAGYLNRVIHADRTVYARLVVDRLQKEGVVSASEQWKDEKALPLPAQMLLYAGRLAAGAGKGVKYRLASLWPIKSGNGPATEFERRGLEAVAQDPSRPYTELQKNGQGHVFKAVYPDRAVSKVCVNCHNGHMLSPRKDYKLNDVMGGVIISFPVDRE